MSPAEGAAPAPSRARIIIAFAAVYILWGSTYLAIRHAVQEIPPFLMIGTRFLFAGSLMVGWTLLRGAARPTLAQLRSTAIIGFLLLLCGNGALAFSEQYVPSGLAALIVATMPFWMVMLEAMRKNGAKPTRRTIAGLVLGLVGLLVLVGPSEVRGGSEHIAPVAVAALLLGCIAWAGGSVYSRGASLPKSPLLTTGLEMLAAGVMLMILGTVTGEWSQLHVAAISATAWLSVAYLVVFGSLIGFTAYVWLLGVAPAAQVSTYAYVNPVVAVFLGWLVDGDPIGPRVIVAAAIILGSVAVITRTGSAKNGNTRAPVGDVPARSRRAA